jgi:hypothetical protein
MLTEQIFLDAGYRRYSVSESARNAYKMADFLLQKRFDDEYGKRYYISVYAYDWRKHRGVHINLPDFSFAPDVQFRESEFSKCTFDISMITDESTTVEQIEDHYEKLWNFFGKPYYESWAE